MHLLPLFALGSLVLPGLAIDTENKKICQTKDDKNTCTVTVVRHRDHAFPGQPGTVDSTWAYVLDNECNSIIDSDDCNSDGEVGTLCKQDIGEDETTVELSATTKPGPFVVTATGDGEGLQDTPPIFYVYYDDNATVSDEESNDDPCTCAQSVHDLADDEVCSCWVDCSD